MARIITTKEGAQAPTQNAFIRDEPLKSRRVNIRQNRWTHRLLRGPKTRGFTAKMLAVDRFTTFEVSGDIRLPAIGVAGQR